MAFVASQLECEPLAGPDRPNPEGGLYFGWHLLFFLLKVQYCLAMPFLHFDLPLAFLHSFLTSLDRADLDFFLFFFFFFLAASTHLQLP